MAESYDIRSIWFVGREGEDVGESIKYTRRVLGGLIGENWASPPDDCEATVGERELRLRDWRAAGAERRRAFLSTRMGSVSSGFGGGMRVSQIQASMLTLKPTELMAWAARVTKRVLCEDMVEVQGQIGICNCIALSLGDKRAIDGS